jgi:hypothetical protein
MVTFDRDAVDYSLYLVTGRELLPEGKVSPSHLAARGRHELIFRAAGLL